MRVAGGIILWKIKRNRKEVGRQGEEGRAKSALLEERSFSSRSLDDRSAGAEKDRLPGRKKRVGRGEGNNVEKPCERERTTESSGATRRINEVYLSPFEILNRQATVPAVGLAT